MLERIAQITERWFLSEEPLFSAFCTHRVAENREMKCHVRVGKGVIEVNPDLDRELEERLRIEVIRILLKHPYDRQPDGCSILARALGSNCVIGDSYRFQKVQMERPQDFELPSNQHFEYYARRIQGMLPQVKMSLTGDSDGDADGNSDIAANWQQDELMAAQINETIRNVKGWGSMPGKLVEEIIASTKARVDYRKILAGFRATILSEKRKLTRMRPNRRFGFDAMGSRYDFTTRLIIGVDCSGSITKNDLKNFYSTINRFFWAKCRRSSKPLRTSRSKDVAAPVSSPSSTSWPSIPNTMVRSSIPMAMRRSPRSPLACVRPSVGCSAQRKK